MLDPEPDAVPIGVATLPSVSARGSPMVVGDNGMTCGLAVPAVWGALWTERVAAVAALPTALDALATGVFAFASGVRP